MELEYLTVGSKHASHLFRRETSSLLQAAMYLAQDYRCGDKSIAKIWAVKFLMSSTTMGRNWSKVI